MYKELILENDYSKRIVWYDEGMAQFLSGELNDLNDIEKFIDFYNPVKLHTKIIPNINEISHGKDFVNDNYNGYELSYIAIRYLSEILPKNEFLNLMSDFEQIKQYGNTILDDAFNYYDKNLTKQGVKK